MNWKMKSKREVVNDLKEQGVNVTYEDGVVMFHGITMQSAKKLCKVVGYNSSYGCKESMNEHSSFDGQISKRS